MPANNEAERVQKDDSLPLDAQIEPHLAIDITAYLCPMTFVRTRLALDRLSPGQHLAVRLRGAEPRRNVAASVAELGHLIRSLIDHADGTTMMLIEKR